MLPASTHPVCCSPNRHRVIHCRGAWSRKRMLVAGMLVTGTQGVTVEVGKY